MVIIFGGETGSASGHYSETGFFSRSGSFSSVAISTGGADIDYYYKNTDGDGDTRITLTVDAYGFTIGQGSSTVTPLNYNGHKYNYIIFK